MAHRIDLPWGYVEFGPTGYENEVLIVSTVEDPPKVRLGATAGGSMGCISFNRVRTDRVQEEVVLIQGKIDERFRSVDEGGRATHTELVGELRVDVRRPKREGMTDDASMVPVCQMFHDKVVFHVPVVGAETAGATSFLRSPNGRYDMEMQDDGNIVVYDEANGHTPIAAFRPGFGL